MDKQKLKQILLNKRILTHESFPVEADGEDIDSITIDEIVSEMNVDEDDLEDERMMNALEAFLSSEVNRVVDDLLNDKLWKKLQNRNWDWRWTQTDDEIILIQFS